MLRRIFCAHPAGAQLGFQQLSQLACYVVERAQRFAVNVWDEELDFLSLQLPPQHALQLDQVAEDGTSKVCAKHGCEVQQGPRGLVRCPYGHVVHADVNAAMNILARGGGKVPARVRVRSFIPTASKVISVNEKNSNPAPRAG